MNTRITDIILPSLFCLALGHACNTLAAPTLKLTRNTFEIAEAVDADILAQIKAGIGKVDQGKLGFSLSKIKDDDLAALCAAYPATTDLSIRDSAGLTSIAPVAGLKGLTSMRLEGSHKVADLTPLAGLTGMQSLDLTGSEFAPDLKWMSAMTKLTRVTVKGYNASKKITSFEGIPSLPALKSVNLGNTTPADLTPLVSALPALETLDLSYCVIKDLSPLAKLARLKELNLYGAEVKDFSPLAGAAALRKLTYYAVTGADFSTLGKLTQVENLQGGLTKLADISWVADLPNLREFRVFAEYIKDYTPLAKTKVEHFTIWNMRETVDLTQLSGATSFSYLKLWGLKKATGFEGLATLVNIKELTIDDVNQKEGIPVDMSFVKTLANVEKLTLTSSNVINFDAVAACVKLTSVDLNKSIGITSLAALKKLPALKTLTVAKDAFPAAELEGFDAKVRITQR